MNPIAGAFPLESPGGEMQRGIGQRDLVALIAMQALIVSSDGTHDIDKLLEKAFKIADAFIIRACKRE